MSTIFDHTDQRLGARIRSERVSRSWSLSDLAERSGVSRAMINRVERGNSSPTAALLARLAGAFRLSMSTLIARAELSGGLLLRHAEQPVWTDPETGYVRRHLSPGSDVPLDLVQIDLPAGAEVQMPASLFAFVRQMIWVISGELRLREGDAAHVLGAGDCLTLGSPSDCLFANEGERVCRYLTVVLRSG